MKKLFAIITVMLLVAMLTVTASAADSQAAINRADFDGDGAITKDDAIYLLMYTFFPEDYPITENADFNRDGSITKDDAIYVLMHTFFPEDYPLCEHEPVIDKSVEPTCTEEGLTEGKHCAKCGCVLISQTKVDALGHTEVIDEAVAPTCTQDGKTKGKHCSRCTEILVTQTKVGAFGHTEGKWITEREPTEYESGLKCVYCTVCGDKLNEKMFKYSQGLKYSVNNDDVTCTITGIGTCIDSELYIPNVIDGYTVTSIGNSAFYNCTNLTSIKIPNSVTSIGNYAFEDCKSLTSVEIGNSVTSIGEYAFSGCLLPKKVYITDLEAWINIKFGSSDSNPCHYGADLYLNDELVTNIAIPDSITSIGNYAFSNCKSLTSIKIPDSVTRIGDWAFKYCENLTIIELPDGVTSIGEQTFFGCTSLISITIGNRVKSIGDYAFRDCTSLTSINIPNSVKSIGEYAFSGCTSLASIKFNGTKAQWKDISKGSRWYNFIPAKVVVCGDGKVSVTN